MKSLSEEVLGARSLDFEGGGKLLELGQVFGPCLCTLLEIGLKIDRTLITFLLPQDREIENLKLLLNAVYRDLRFSI